MRLLAPTGPERPTAIFAANDLSCVGALSAAAALGVRVPAELSLVGFDNSHLARLRALWLTSVDGAAYTMGQRAARMLLARIARPDAPREVTLMPPRLEVRRSSGPGARGLSALVRAWGRASGGGRAGRRTTAGRTGRRRKP